MNSMLIALDAMAAITTQREPMNALLIEYISKIYH
jgi:hypothetical protein